MVTCAALSRRRPQPEGAFSCYWSMMPLGTCGIPSSLPRVTRHQSVLTTAHARLKQRNMPTRFWGEAVTTAVFLLNRAPTMSLEGKTPYEAYHGRQPRVGFLKTFGCLDFVKDKRPGLKKLDDRRTSMVFIGYYEGAKKHTGSWIQILGTSLSPVM
jgi:hypothetical protein